MLTIMLRILMIWAVALIAACDRTPAFAPFTAPVVTDADNAYEEYAAVVASDARRFLENRWDVLNDPSWTPDSTLVKQLDALRPQIECLLTASKRPKLEAPLAKAQAVPIHFQCGLLEVEAIRRRSEGNHDGAAVCIAAMLRLAKQVRTHDDLLTFTSQCSTALRACKQAVKLDLASLTGPAKEELRVAVERMLSEGPYERDDRDEMSDRSFRESREALQALDERLKDGR